MHFVSRPRSDYNVALILYIYCSILICFVLGKTLEECSVKGYNSTNLKCSSCSSLTKYQLLPLEDDCLQCCQSVEDEPAVKKYSKARLEICTCKFGAYPQIQAFIKSKLPAQHPNLQIRYVHGRDPIIKLMDRNEEIKEVIAIEKWNTETVDEFLKTHVDNENRDYLMSNLI